MDKKRRPPAQPEPSESGIKLTRRELLTAGAAIAAAGVIAPRGFSALAAPFNAPSTSQPGSPGMTMVCIIRYEIDPYQREAFKQYAENWGLVIPRCGGRLVGYFMPWQGTNYVGWGLIAFDSLAAYEAYQARLRKDPDGKRNFAFAQAKRFIHKEERNFVEVVDGTFNIPAHMG